MPFVLLTGGYLLLRYAVFGQVARESMLGTARLDLFLQDVSTHLRRMVFGEPGVAMSAIAACAGFGAVCGSSLATASTMGQVALPELRRYRYSPELATGTLAAGGVLGILIPPSVVLVVYAIVVEASIVEMFIAAFIPGFIAR